MTPDERTRQIPPAIQELALTNAIAQTICHEYIHSTVDYTRWLERSLIFALQQQELTAQTLTDVIKNHGRTVIRIDGNAP